MPIVIMYFIYAMSGLGKVGIPEVSGYILHRYPGLPHVHGEQPSEAPPLILLQNISNE